MLPTEVPEEGEEEEAVQPVHLPSKNKTVNIVIHHDTSTKKDILLWDDTLMVFPNALNLQHQSRAVPFLKDDNLNTYVPPLLSGKHKVNCRKVYFFGTHN